jgi:hypothetical protein
MPAMAGLINRCLQRVTDGSLNTARRARLPSFEMAHPPNRGGDDTDLETLGTNSPMYTPKMGEDNDETWTSPPPLRRYTIKGGTVQQVTDDSEHVR